LHIEDGKINRRSYNCPFNSIVDHHM